MVEFAFLVSLQEDKEIGKDEWPYDEAEDAEDEESSDHSYENDYGRDIGILGDYIRSEDVVYAADDDCVVDEEGYCDDGASFDEEVNGHGHPDECWSNYGDDC